MSDDPAIRSVRVAVVLCDRFAELLKGPSTVTASKQSGALLGVSGNTDDMSLRIGEVQQIYPEIWRHLDEARATFASRGIDVAAYDAIRATEGLALGAAVDVQHTRFIAGRHTVDNIVKSANFNRDGYRRACTAYTALMRATPQIDWAGIARAEAEDPAVVAFQRSTRRKRWIRLGLLVAVIASPFAYVGHTCKAQQDEIDAHEEALRGTWEPVASLGNAERAELDAAIAPTRQRLAAARRGWPAAMMKDALAAADPTDKPCEYAFAGPTADAAERFIRSGRVDAGFGAGSFTSFPAGEPVRDDELAAAAATVEGIASRARQGYAARGDLQQLQQLPSHVVVFIIDREVQPGAGSDASEVPGEVAGRGYVYSVARGQVVCAGVVDVRNSPDQVTRARRAGTKLLIRELEARIRQALATGLHAT